MGKRIPELVTFEFPGTTSEEVFKQVFSEGKWKGEFNFVHPKTSIKTHLLSSINLLKNMEGEISGFIITSKDITDRKQAADKLEKREAQLLASIENTPNIAVQWYNDKGEVLYWNRASELMYGWTSDEAAGKTLDKLIHTPEEAAEFLKALEQVARTGSTIGPSEYEFRRRDGTKGSCIATIFSIPADEGGLCFVCMDVDITESKKAEELLQKSYEDIRQLASNLQTIREDERTTIAREIHDELGQQLTGLKLNLHWVLRKLSSTDDEITGKMKECIELINETIASVRKISTDLRPSILDDLGLLPALEWHGEEFEKRSGTKVMFINDVGDIIVSPEVATGIFRIYQELLTNIARHANASLVKASLSKDENRLYFSIKDNGVGFDLETIKNKKTLGLLGIKERTLLFGGSYEFISKPGEGSVTTISIPLQLVKPTFKP